MIFHSGYVFYCCRHLVELQEQLERAMRLEEERRRVEQEAARLEAERMEAIIAKEELARQAEDQLRSQELLVSLLHARKSANQPFYLRFFYGELSRFRSKGII